MTGVTFPAGSLSAVVGRTGSGKSTLALSLFRLVEAASGSIAVDGVDIATVGLRTLRSRVAIVPQDPCLFAGTIRKNLDPFDDFSDAQLWNALEMVRLADARRDFSEPFFRSNALHCTATVWPGASFLLSALCCFFN